ncbi:MAG TPA: hypothetical protein VMT15_18915 [Bryobacteraceae bacterium]|nr:hypothetical protein [Bryobacteraceae bacterium]
MRLLAPALMLAMSCFASDELAPQVNTVLPRVVKPGDTVLVTGVSLGEDRVEELYLSDHKFDMKVKVLDQNAQAIKFRIPPFAKPGRMQLLMLMKPEKEGDNPKLLEIPAYLLIEDISTTEITQAQPLHEKGKKATQEPQKDQQKDPQKDPL